MGLTLATDKCEVVPVAGENHQIHASRFQGFKWNQSGNFKLLGAPLGSELHCTIHTRDRVCKAADLLGKVGALADTQCALHHVLLQLILTACFPRARADVAGRTFA